MLKGLLSKNWALLKSDHFGIEIEDETNGPISIGGVKIRPFWD